MAEHEWYKINNVDGLDTPAVVIYVDRVKQNIQTLIQSVDDLARLRPHIKTHKSPEVTSLLLVAGDKKIQMCYHRGSGNARNGRRSGCFVGLPTGRSKSKTSFESCPKISTNKILLPYRQPANRR